MVRCPRTGQDFPSGIETDSLSFERTPAFSGTIRCPICGVDHPWSKLDTWLAETDASPARRPDDPSEPPRRRGAA